MKKTRVGKWIAAIGASLTFLFAFIFSVGGGILTDLPNDGESGRITASAANEDSHYDTLADGSAYYFTDASRIEGFRNGSDTSDTSHTDVQSSAAHGSAANPFVINTVDQWTYFAGDTANAQNKDKVFVLGSDLDFSGKTFTPVPSLSAKFYGTNHILKNITHNFGNAGNCGVFRVITSSSVVTDLSLDNFVISGIACSATGHCSGALIGTDNGASVLNCHIRGTLTASNSYYSSTTDGNNYSAVGGLIGTVAGGTEFVYRCSAKIKFNLNQTSHNGNSGLIGSVNKAANLSIFDCFVILDLQHSVTSVDAYFGGLVCLPMQRGYINKVAINGCVMYMSEKYSGTPNASLDGVILSGYGNTITTTRAEITMNNVYVGGNRTNPNGSASGIYAATWYYGNPSTGSDVNSVTLTGGGNINWYAPTVTSVGTAPCNLFANKGVSTNYLSSATGRSDLYNAAASSIALSSNIWVNKSVINEAYMTNTDITSTSGYTIENSPVRNPLVVRVSYYNYTTSGDVQYEVDGSTEPIVAKAGDTLYVPTATNRKFLGWTTDKTGKSTPFFNMPNNLLGDNKLYAVWEVDKSSVNIVATALSNSDFATDGDTGEHSMTYNGNGGSNGVTLTANLTATGMNDAQITYQWAKDNKNIESGGTAKTLKVENVPDSGSYTVTLKYQSASEPLFTGETESVQAAKVTIKPASLTMRSAYFEDGLNPYSGAPYSTAVPTAIVFDKNGDRIDGTTAWAVDLGNFNGNGADVTGGRETKEIAFTPDAKYNGNYGTEPVTFTFEFEIKYLTFTFNIPRYKNTKLVVNLEYGQNYSYNNIATLFEDAFAPYMSDESLGGQTPVFLVNSQRIKLNDYRKMGTGGNTTAYPSVKQSYSLEVDFDAQSYEVTYNPMNGEDSWKETIGHGIRLAKPSDPEYGMQLFLGWFYEDTDDGGTTSEKAWNFDADRVTREIELYAKWLNADTLTKLEVTISPTATFHARDTIDPSLLTVTATFAGTAEGQTLTQKKVLSFGEYSIVYERGNAIHLNADGTATNDKITYKFKDTTLETPLNLSVEPIVLDTSVLKPYFKDSTVVVEEGVAKSITITTNITQRIPQLSNEVEYEYQDADGFKIDAADAKDIGTYTVIAHFKPSSPDYKAPDISAVLTIIAEQISLTYSYDTLEFVYNGKVQVPAFTFTDSDGNTVEAGYTLTGDYEATDAGDNYSVTIVLDDKGYALNGLGTVNFSIKKAKVKVPTQKSPFTYKGEDFDLNGLSEDDYALYFEGFDPAMMEAVDGTFKTKDAGTYNASVALKNPKCAEWEEATTARVNMSWKINKAQLTVDWDGYEYVANGAIQTPKVRSFYTLYGEDKEAVDYANDIQYTGDVSVTEVGNYTVTVVIRSGAIWSRNYELDDTKSWSFVIVPDLGLEIITIEWGKNNLFEYNGSVQRPVFTVKNAAGTDITDSVRGYIVFNEEARTSKWAGDYTATVTLNAAGAGQYFLRGKTSCAYTIITNAAGEGEDPNQNGGGNEPEGPGTIIPGPSENTNELPLWQLIVGGISAILFVVCSAKAFGEYGKYKAAKKEAKELAQVSYSVTYGFAPLPLMAISFLGLGETPWTIIAFAALGLFLVSLAALLVLSKKRKAAELVVKREQARIEEEKEYARQDEQQRRDNEFKMMFAAMQQNSQPQMQYDDMRSLLAETVTALLPGLQQSMQALPPAQAPDQYAAPAPDQYGAPAPQYAPPAAPQYAAPSPEADALRAQMAAQQEQMAQQQAQMAQQQAQMAQQQELINKLLQNQQAAPAPAPAPEPAPAYDGYAASAQEEAFWTVEGEEIVSLEELYGKLSDDAKRGYYEIGSYIMNKPQTSQNDGKYAVLFKYRGKTLFKLCIKNDAPVLYYPADNGGRAELLIVDAAALQVAKSIVDVHIAKTDSEMA